MVYKMSTNISCLLNKVQYFFQGYQNHILSFLYNLKAMLLPLLISTVLVIFAKDSIGATHKVDVKTLNRDDKLFQKDHCLLFLFGMTSEDTKVAINEQY